jgi:hypothetical protein
MRGIFVGIPTTQEYKPFRESLSVFLEGIKQKYDVEVLEIKHHMRDDAREIIVDEFLKSDKEILLFLDDDHSGHSPEMLDALINSNALFCSMKCYARYYPFQITTVAEDINYHDKNNLYLINTNKGYAKCKFVGFGMATIRRELFELIEKPYFKCDMLGEREDNYFCEKLIAAGVDPIGCFDYVLAHQGIDNTNILEKRQKGLKEFVRDVNQRLTVKRIQAAIKCGKIKLNDRSRGQLEIVDVVLNNHIAVLNNTNKEKEVVVLTK